MINAGVIGATGYAGSELIRILMQHKEVNIKRAASQTYEGKAFSSVYGNFFDLASFVCEKKDTEKMAEECDVIFMALPHGVAAKEVTEGILEKTRVIDFGADFRLKNPDIYEKWYGIAHEGRNLLKKAVYGLPELIKREEIKKARLIANPGCYTTCSILTLAPLLKNKLIDSKSIIIDAKSGVSGAGRSVGTSTLFCEVNESVKAYKIGSHRHTPEIEEQLSYAAGEDITLSFTPHLVPMNRGILATCYASLKKGVSKEDIRAAYKAEYDNEYFIRLLPEGVFPETRWVKGSNFTDIGFAVDERCGRIITVGALDNLVKGAAGQAVQNMNIMFGIDEGMGLTDIPLFPA